MFIKPCFFHPAGRWMLPAKSRFLEADRNELSDFSQLWHDGCGETIIGAQDVDRNHSPEV